MERPLIIIPARMGASRLPNKPLRTILGKPLIVHVWEKASSSGFAPVVVACDHEDIAMAIENSGGRVVMTSSAHLTGSDRVAEAVDLIDPQEHYSVIINLQGDLPHFDPSLLARLIEPFEASSDVDMVTFTNVPSLEEKQSASQIVRVVCETEMNGQAWRRCLDFGRTLGAEHPQHIGIYAYRRTALRRFAKLRQTEREKHESLEQLRALENGFNIVAIPLFGEVFMSIDTPADLASAKKHMAAYLIKTRETAMANN